MTDSMTAWRPACARELAACLRMWLWRVPGLFVVNKPSGPSSFDVIRAARRELGVRKIGHSGTLDPLAGGVLILGAGKATRVLSVLSGLDKSYRAGVRFGVRTDTFDTTGRVLEERDASGLTGERVGEALAGFRGAVDQVPPMHSALKKDGQPLYKLARKGIEVTRKPRRIEIARLELVGFSRDAEDGRPEAELEIDCSKGTYIRALVDDLGRALGTGAVMTALVRTRVGPFGIETAREPGRLLG
jgi:tRNA pseudouridine55 synthase